MAKPATDSPMILEIKIPVENAQKYIAQQVNTELHTKYWEIGRIIVAYDQKMKFGQNMVSRH